MLLGVDVGGTFTDAALVADGRVHVAKTPTTPDDQSRGVLAAIDAVLAAAGSSARSAPSGPQRSGTAIRRPGGTSGATRARARS
jgi:N-methylhydantoinase A/oxoprolinase/acetone carboxylase beta subunit